MPLPRVTEFAHLLVKRCLTSGGHAIDATVGNGYDTCFLAGLVGTEGRVDGFDIQNEAIARTREKTAGLPQVHLHHLGHEQMGEQVPEPVEVVMFNLGYLPSGDKSVITRPSSTLPALDAALALLKEGGLLVVVVYPGHDGGEEEAAEVDGWFGRLSPETHRVVHYGPPQRDDRKRESPYLLAVWRER